MVAEQLSLSDFREIALSSLPVNLKDCEKTILNGKYCLQVTYFEFQNIINSYYKHYMLYFFSIANIIIYLLHNLVTFFEE